MKGPVTVEAVNRLVAEFQKWRWDEELEWELVRGVLLAVADGHPDSARLAKAALRAFDV